MAMMVQPARPKMVLACPSQGRPVAYQVRQTTPPALERPSLVAAPAAARPWQASLAVAPGACAPAVVPVASLLTSPYTRLPQAPFSMSAAACSPAAAALGSAAAGATVFAGGRGDVVLCLGDSLTKGVNDRRHNYPQILEALLQEMGYRLRVHNAGVNAEDCSKIAWRLPYALKDAERSGRVAVVLILAGTNDILKGGFYCSKLLEQLERLHQQASASQGAPLVGVMTLPPAKVKETKEVARLHLNEKLRDVNRDRPGRFVVDLESISIEKSYDGLHFGHEGCHEIAERAFQAMLPHLGCTP